VLIDWDRIYNWKIWQVFKWMIGFIILGVIIYGIINIDKCIEWQKFIMEFVDKNI